MEIPSNTRVYIGCHDGYEESLTSGEPVLEDDKYSVCAKGYWSPIYQCKLSNYDLMFIASNELVLFGIIVFKIVIMEVHHRFITSQISFEYGVFVDL